ncbi:MAG: hypothetical protein J6Z41_06460 [Prevotella sp.]|jgi:uncharacterized membrane protein YfcA|nr:hypothetical protein [Prevotella sp.]
MDNILYYVIALIAIIIGVVILKKVASCLLKTVFTIILLAILAYLYYRMN